MQNRFKVDSFVSLPLEKTMTFYNVIILIKSVFDKYNSNYYYNIFLEKNSYELPNNKFLYKIKMLHYHRIVVSQGFYVNKISKPKEWGISHYWYSLDKGFNSQSHVWNGCHDLLMLSMKISAISNLNIKGADYCCITSGIRKCNAINLMQNIDLTGKSETL